MLFNEAYIKNIFFKLIFKKFTLENSKKKGPNISIVPESGPFALGPFTLDSYDLIVGPFPLIIIK
jgi:hypothetical protein